MERRRLHGRLLYSLQKGGGCMKGGFSFCGTDIADLGIEYAPELKDTNVYRPAKSNIHEETFDGHDGSYIYGASKEAKEFILRVFFEEKVIDRGLMARVYNLFKVGKSGKLIFKRRPWCYYYATVTDVDDTELRNYMNGLITITMKAAYPFSRFCSNDNDDEADFCNTYKDEYHDAIMLNTALFDKKGMKPPTAFGSVDSPIETGFSFILANPGTERAKVGIIAEGSAGRGVIIKNNTTGQECKLVAMSMEKTTNANKHVFIDGLNGKTSLVSNDENNPSSVPCFLYHDHGFIELSPAYPCLREVFATYDGYTVETLNLLYENYKDYYIFLNNKWKKIESNTKQTITLVEDGDPLPIGEEQTTIMRMNELTVQTIGNASLTRLCFVYKPTFA